MSMAGYYPPGACYDPSAPYNEVPVPERKFNVCVSQTLSKETTVVTRDYQLELDDEDGSAYANTENTDWREVYKSDHDTITTLLKLLKDYIRKDLEYGDSKHSRRQLEYWLQECQGWVEDDMEVIEE